MRVAMYYNNNDVRVEEMPKPQIGPGEILVKVIASGICGSDVMEWYRIKKAPLVLGHEITGDIAEVGHGVERYKVGDRVFVSHHVPCNTCRYCLNGNHTACETLHTTNFYPGGFAEYLLVDPLVINYGPIHKIPDNLDYDEAAIAEPLACCINGLELAWVSLGDIVVIIGAGPVGCMMAELARYMGARKVIVSQRSKTRLEMAKNYDIDVLISATEEDFTQRVMEETDGLGADVVVTACSSLEAQAQAIPVIKNRGRVNFFAGLPKGTDPLVLDTNIIHYKECYLFGSHGSTPRHHRMALELLASGRVNAGKFISHKFGLDQIMDAFDMVESRQGMKVVVNP